MGPGMKAALMSAMVMGALATPTYTLKGSKNNPPSQKPYTVNRNGKRTLKK